MNDQLDIFLRLWLIIFMKIVVYPCNIPIFNSFIPLKALSVEKIDSFPEIVQACLNGVLLARSEIQLEDSLAFSR